MKAKQQLLRLPSIPRMIQVACLSLCLITLSEAQEAASRNLLTLWANLVGGETDTDADGLPDNIELASNGEFDPEIVDTNSNGIDDFVEFMLAYAGALPETSGDNANNEAVEEDQTQPSAENPTDNTPPPNDSSSLEFTPVDEPDGSRWQEAWEQDWWEHEGSYYWNDLPGTEADDGSDYYWTPEEPSNPPPSPPDDPFEYVPPLPPGDYPLPDPDGPLPA